MGISFFQVGGVGYCRSNQVAEYLGSRVNPKKDYEDDVCIYVKWHPPTNTPKNSYFDIVDSKSACTWLMANPQMKVIVISKTSWEFIAEGLNRTDLVLIPHHHCNYERERRSNREITTVGVIGNEHAFLSTNLEEAKEKFRYIGLDFIYERFYKNRSHVVDFYKKIDIQVVWRPHMRIRLCNPLKLSNAGSFGIPTVAYPEGAYSAEWSDSFVPALSINEMVAQVERLKNEKNYYDDMSNKAIAKSEEYHMEKISKLYFELETFC